MDDFDKSVFINCPFDADYRQMILSILFTVKYLGFIPKVSLEKSDAGTARLANIVSLVESCKFGIHDLSRILAIKKGDYARMNMPFELGIDYGCKVYKGGHHKDKKILVLEKDKYRYQKALSDLSGSDIKSHNDEPIKVVQAIRDWFVTEELKRGVGYTRIWYAFNDFTSDLYDKLVAEGHESKDFNEVPIPEIMSYMDLWFKKV
ncbi:hypothetical protein [Bathymodiolus thermophilus thioautotrophic gill symbiont]|uniref:Uncharacterized protein n=1 Tax=Bathymodiolus thermophilus thioautotrophic gill symbiont TaxID=2360 RepID=A0A1J5U803_9GAMM|nr:hypothetical protein [Bathymodiolus thermophilus thioautotrophic gill symbiont]OIR24974.1 hypothetical protein BGC33_05095 [Bathymodiolus thermophilus thioautotrophic gill symbiont]